MSGAVKQFTQAPPTSSVVMIVTLASVSLISGLLIVMAYEGTLPRITENKRRAIERAVFEVLPGAVTRTNFAESNGALTPIEGENPDGPTLYVGKDADGKLVGVALEASGQGYQDTIRVLYGYSPERAALIGFTVIESRETPGLGDKIAKDPAFLANFDGLVATMNADKSGLEHPIEAVKHGNKTDPWQIDGVSGATISSVAVGRMLNESAGRMIPPIHAHLDDLKAGS